MNGIVYEGLKMLKEAAEKNKVHFSTLVAETALWANPEVYKTLVEENGTGAWFPNTRRVRVGQGEKRGNIIDGVRLDDNTYANNAIKRAIGLPRNSIIGFETCHIWPDTCYDQRYHTLIPNLVLIPRAIASLTDHDPEIQAALQYRSFELYGWYPQGNSRPMKPEYYPCTWREPEPFSDEVRRSIIHRLGETVGSVELTCLSKNPQLPTQNRKCSNEMDLDERLMMVDRINRWAKKPFSIVHKTIALVVRTKSGIPREVLVQEVKRLTGNKNSYGTVSSLMTSKGNAYGRAFIDIDGIVAIHPDLVEEVENLSWSV